MSKDAQSQHSNQQQLEGVKIKAGCCIYDTWKGLQEGLLPNMIKEYAENQPTIRVGDEEYIDHRHHAAFTSDATEKLAGKEYNKLMRCTWGSYKVTEVETYSVVINEDCVLNRTQLAG